MEEEKALHEPQRLQGTTQVGRKGLATKQWIAGPV